MGLCNAGEVLQHVLDGELHGDSRSRVTPADQVFKVLVLTDELVLHGVPHYLMDKRKGSVSERNEDDATFHVCSDAQYLQQTFLLTQMLVYFLIQIIQSLLNFFPRIFFDNFAQLLLVEGQVVAHLLLADTLGHTGLNSLEEMLQGRQHNSTERHEQKPQIVAIFPPTLSFSRGWPRELMT